MSSVGILEAVRFINRLAADTWPHAAIVFRRDDLKKAQIEDRPLNWITYEQVMTERQLEALLLRLVNLSRCFSPADVALVIEGIRVLESVFDDVD